MFSPRTACQSRWPTDWALSAPHYLLSSSSPAAECHTCSHRTRWPAEGQGEARRSAASSALHFAFRGQGSRGAGGMLRLSRLSTSHWARRDANWSEPAAPFPSTDNHHLHWNTWVIAPPESSTNETGSCIKEDTQKLSTVSRRHRMPQCQG